VAFQEDKLILEAIHQKERSAVNPRPVKLAIDASPMRMRKMVQDMIDAEAAGRGQGAAAPQRAPAHA